MKKLFTGIVNAANRIPLVETMQVTALVVLTVVLARSFYGFAVFLFQPYLTFEKFGGALMMLIFGILSSLFQPLVILALAEIVKAKKK
jgi:hypothetical protein